MMNLINPFDRDALKAQIESAEPYPHFYIDNFLNEDFANEIHDAFPPFEVSQNMGRMFNAVNERRKVQITESEKFPQPILKLHQLLASQDFLDMMAYLMGIPNLVADPELSGGGIHETGPGGHLDVHVDFNLHAKTKFHRRLNILVFFNKNWKEEYGGNFEVWDEKVKKRYTSIQPVFNRCACFATSETSFHGVTSVNCPPDMSRKSFAAYYYTKEAPEKWSGADHSTIFKARPNEILKGKLLMPLETTGRRIRSKIRDIRNNPKK